MTEPTDEEIMELMPQQMRDDLANAARALAGFDRANVKAAGAMRIILNRHAVDHARAVLAKWGTPAIEPVAHQDRLDRLIALDRDDPANTINQEGNGMTAIRDALIAIAAELEAR